MPQKKPAAKKPPAVRSPKKKAVKSPSAVPVSTEKECLSPEEPTFYMLMVDDRLRHGARILRELYRDAYGGDPRMQKFRDTDLVLLEFGDCAEIEAYQQKLGEYARRMAEIEPCEAAESVNYAETYRKALEEMGLPVDTETKSLVFEAASNVSVDKNGHRHVQPCWGPYTRSFPYGTKCILFLTQLLRKMFFRHIDWIADTRHGEYPIPSKIADAAEVYVQTSNSIKAIRCEMIQSDGFQRIQEAHKILLEFLEKIVACKADSRKNIVSIQLGDDKEPRVALNEIPVRSGQAFRTLLVLAMFRERSFSVEEFHDIYKKVATPRDPSQKKDPSLAGLFQSCMDSVKEIERCKKSRPELESFSHSADNHGQRTISGLQFRIGSGLDGPEDLKTILESLPLPKRGKKPTTS